METSLFQGGRIKQFLDIWKSLTSDPEIIQTVSGVHLEFNKSRSTPRSSPFKNQPLLNKQEVKVIDSEIQKLSAKGVIEQCEFEPGQFVSPVFTRPKKDGTHRMILNLKCLNRDIAYHHFKMETLQAAALKLVTQDCFMASIDLKDAYYSVPIFEGHKKFLRFEWDGKMWQFNCMPNGLALAPRKFTKLLKPVFATLREKGHLSTVFLDDSLLLAETRLACMQNVIDTVQLLRSVGFIVHPGKSVLEPSHCVQYLGVIIDSKQMITTLTPDRSADLLSCCKTAMSKLSMTIRYLAKVIGKIVAAFPAVKYGPLYYRQLEKEKKAALASSKGDFDCCMSLSFSAKSELQWWIDNVSASYNNIHQSAPDITLSSDASLTGWGCALGDAQSGGLWLPVETQFHINYLELKAAYFALLCFQDQLIGKHVRILVDNTTAVACINHMGTSHSDTCDSITNTMWLWCITHDIWLSAAHIAGKDNTAADSESRKINLDTEWKLDETVLTQALSSLQVKPTIDLFASRLNKQMDRYVSYKPDPEAFAVDAFSMNWGNVEFYAFPPFSVITQVLMKIRQDMGIGVVVVPRWTTQVWWPLLNNLLIQEPVEMEGKELLTLPSHPGKLHPLHRSLRLLVCNVSGNAISRKASHNVLQT